MAEARQGWPFRWLVRKTCELGVMASVASDFPALCAEIL